jgi:purine nucleosidase
MPKKILLDTDPGIDDACAILLALASPEISLEGLSIVHGNSSLEQGTKNALSILELAHASHIPVVKGCELPLVQPSLLAPETHGDTGMGYAQLPEARAQPKVQHGIDFLIEQILSSPGEITLVAIGPLTNISLAIRQEPRIVEAVKELIIMGGALHCLSCRDADGPCPTRCDLSVHFDSERCGTAAKGRFPNYTMHRGCNPLLHGVPR